jgi:hypothetical protein
MCLGARPQAGLVVAVGERGTPSDTMRSMRDHEAVGVIQDCIAEKGYVMMPTRELNDGLAER